MSPSDSSTVQSLLMSQIYNAQSYIISVHYESSKRRPKHRPEKERILTHPSAFGE